MKQKLLSILFWSVISAAFIGPGTVTTAAAAGAGFGMQILWALVFSTLGCIVLQEAAARVSIATGKNLGEAISRIYSSRKILIWIILFAIITGGAAYQAGNILGAVSGLDLVLSIDPRLATLGLAIAGSLLLWFGKIERVAHFMGILVAIMGVAFMIMAIQIGLPEGSTLQGLVPTIPEGSQIFIVGLIGTTIVPYNLFLASGISKGQTVSEMRWGLIPAILLGGLISIAIMIVGAEVRGEFSFQALSEALTPLSGQWSDVLLATGLFSAGFTSSITAPLATAVTGKSLMGDEWHERSLAYRICWGIVVLSGLVFGVSGVKPIPVIIMAQAFNGFLLPGVTILLIIILNHPSVMPKLNSMKGNFLLFFVLLITLFLGFNNLGKLVFSEQDTSYYLGVFTLSIIVLALTIFTIINIRKRAPIRIK